MEFDYIIIGSGAVGSSLAYQLSKNNKSLALVDIAKTKKPKIKRRYKAPFIDKCTKSYTHSISNVFGGNTELWASKIYLMTKGEIKDWPIEYDELLSHSMQLAKELNINHDELYNHDDIDDSAFFHRAKRSDLGNIFEYFQLSQRKNITCFEQSTLVDVELNNKNSLIKSIKINQKSFKSKKLKVRKAIIFAAGGLGNLCLYKIIIDKVFKKKDRFNYFPIVDHPHISIGKINVKSIARLNRFKNVEDCILVNGKKNKYAFQISPIYLGDKFFRRLEQSFGEEKYSDLILFFIRNFEKFFSRFKRYILIILRKIHRHNTGSLEVWFEEPVNFRSKVSFSKKKWFNGNVQKLDINYKFQKPNYKILKSELDLYTNNKLYDFYEDQLNEENIYTGLKPSCSTPLKSSPENGELNKNCNVKGINNLFMLGTNVYPSVGVTNPTWTLMVLAFRLSKFLKSNFEN